MPADDSATRHRLAGSAAPALAAWASALRYVGREMRRRRSTPSRRLNVRATLQATVRAGGLPAPVFGSLSEPVYLVLVERISAADHQAELGDESARLLYAQGVSVERYTFDGDARYVRHAPLEGATWYPGSLSLETVLARHADARLIIFSDGDGLIDRYTGLPVAWLPTLLALPAPVLVTPQPYHLWARREWALMQAGLTILPLNGDGLRGLGEFLRGQTPPEQGSASACERMRPAYLRDVDLLLDRRPLDAGTLVAVLQGLERDLGATGVAWLAACAVYPDIHWAITLAVGDCTAPEPGRGAWYAQHLAQLARLPWMRMGFMPDWLRAALLARLPPQSEAAVRTALDAFLAAIKLPGPQHASTLEIAVAPRQRAWNDVQAGLGAWRRRGRVADTREDAIFLHFMHGPRRALAVDAGNVLQRLLYRNGVPLGGPRPWLPLIVLGLVTGAFFLPRIGWLAPEVLARNVAPVPVLIALSGGGDSLAVANSVSQVTFIAPSATPGVKSNASCIFPSLAEVPLSLDARGQMMAFSSSTNSVVFMQIMTNCKEALSWTPQLRAVASGAGGRLWTALLTARDLRRADMLCIKTQNDSVLIARRSVIDPALPTGAGPAVACAYSDDSTVLLIASRSGKLYELGLKAESLVFRDRGKLPSSIGGSSSIALNWDGGTIGIVTTDGKVWVKHQNFAWQALDVVNARAPLAISASGATLAFANAQREVRVWQAPVNTPAQQRGEAKARKAADAARKSPKTVQSAPATATAPAPAPASVRASSSAAASAQVTGSVDGVTERSSPGSRKVSLSAAIPFAYNLAYLSQKDITLDALITKMETLDVLEIALTARISGGGSSAVDEDAMKLVELVKAYLVDKGVNANIIRTDGQGVSSNVPLEASMYKNARGQVVIQVQALRSE